MAPRADSLRHFSRHSFRVPGFERAPREARTGRRQSMSAQHQCIVIASEHPWNFQKNTEVRARPMYLIYR